MAISERAALKALGQAFTGLVRADEPDLTLRQQAILFTVALEAGPHTVRGLAARLGLAKPAVTRALDTLCRLGFLRRVADEADLRNVFIERTVEGMSYLRTLSAFMGDAGVTDRTVATRPEPDMPPVPAAGAAA